MIAPTWQPEWIDYNGRKLLLPRWGTRRNYDRPTLGPAAYEISKALGTPFMAWQEYVADVALEIDPETGLPAYREIWLTVPRQSGKTTLILAYCVHRAIGWGPRQNILYSAQTRNDARKKWEDEHLLILEGSPFRRMFRPRKTNGNEAFIWRNGSLHGITSTTEKAGHGSTLDLGVIDEAFAQEDDRLEQAMKPAMVTRADAQLLGLSTAGTKKKSKYLLGKVLVGRRLVERSLATGDPMRGMAFFDWSAPDDWAVEDPETWRAVMPAMHQPWCDLLVCRDHTITEHTIRADLTTMKESDEGIDGYRRAYLNQWVEKDRPTPVVPMVVWRQLADRESRRAGKVAMALDVTPERTAAAIAVWGERADGKSHVEIVEHRDGTDWVLERVKAIDKRTRPLCWVVDPVSSAGSFIDAMRAAGLKVVEIKARQLVAATGSFHDLCLSDRLRHRDQDSLTDALAVARKRRLEAAWTWDRRKTTDDICPLVAATLALHGYAVSTGGEYNLLDSVI